MSAFEKYRSLVKIDITKLILIMMLFMVLIDMWTGAILIKQPDYIFTPGKVYKLIMLVLLLLLLPKFWPYVLISFITITLSSFFSSLYDSHYFLIINTITNIKYLTFILFLAFLDYMKRKKGLNSGTIVKIAWFTFIVICINQVLGLFGFGKPTYLIYGIPVGTSGFFFEHNAAGIILMIVTAIIQIDLDHNLNTRKLVMFSLIAFLVAFSFATKTAVLGVLFTTMILLHKRSKKVFYFLFLVLLVTISFNMDLILKTNQLTKVINDVNEHGTSGLLSGRSDRLSDAIDNYIIEFNAFEKIVGIGHNRLINDKKLGGSAEIDFIDILKVSGLIGFIIVYGTFILVIINHGIRFFKKRFWRYKVVLMLNVFFLLISSFAGHLLTSGSVGFYLALINIFPNLNSSDNIKQE